MTAGSATAVVRAGLCALLLGTAALLPGQAKADPGERLAGRLTCVVDEPDQALHFGSSRPMSCRYRPVHGRVQRYRAMLHKYGVEIGLFDRTMMQWNVYAPRGRVRRGGLSGGYGGLTAEGALGAGIGGNLLTGGPDGIVLSPIGTQVQTGSFNVTAGVLQFELRYVR